MTRAERASAFPGNDVDVLVAGGGPSGVAAAVAAARRGLRVLLVERYGFFGGMASIARVTTMCGLYMRRGGQPERVVGGLAWEVIERLQARGLDIEPQPVGRSYLIPYDVVRYKDVLDELVLDSGVHVRFHATVEAVACDGRWVREVSVRDKGGRHVVRPRVVIDATGDAELAAAAGVRHVKGEDGALQFPTMMFYMANVDWSRARKVTSGQLRQLMEDAVRRGEFDLPRLTGSFRPTGRPGEVVCNMTKVSRNGAYIDGSDPEDLTFAEFEGRRQVREYAAFLQRHVPGFEQAYVSDYGAQVGVRETRNLRGRYVLTVEDVLGGRPFADGIVRSAWPVEMHGPGGVTRWEWLEDGCYYEVPYRSLLPEEYDNLLVVGRCLSATHEAQASARVSATCFGMGQAAGVAAALALHDGTSVGHVPAAQLREALRQEGAMI